MKNELFMNNSAVSPYKYTFLLAILLITIIASISPLNSLAQEEVTKENGVIPYREWKDYTKEEKDRLRNRWTENDKYENIRKYILDKKRIPDDAVIIEDSSGVERSDLRGIYFPFTNLQGADLKGADLSYADLKGANLQGANLFEAVLQGANLYVANLQGATLMKANLQGAHLSVANLQGANLILADLKEGILGIADLQGANLTEANLQGANLIHADLKEGILSFADLQGANLTEAKLKQADLFGTIFGSTYLWRTNLGEAKNIRYIIWGEKYVINDELIIFLKSQFPKDKYKINRPQEVSSKEYHSQGAIISALHNLIKINETKDTKEKEMISEKEKYEILLQNKQSILEIASISPKSERYTIGEENSGDLKNAEIIYRDLKSFYKERKMHNIASEFHYRENVVKTELSSLPIRIFRTVFLDWTYGYGSRPLRLIPFCFGVILFFGFIYLVQTILPGRSGISEGEVDNNEEEPQFLPADSAMTFINCIYFSALSFATFGYGALRPRQWLEFFRLMPVEYKPVGWARIFVGFEAAIGIYLLALTALVLFKG